MSGILRLPIAFLLGLVIATTLFGFLHAMTSVRGEYDAAQAPVKIEFARLRSDTEIEEKKRAKPEPEKRPAPPVTTELNITKEAVESLDDTLAIDRTLSSDVEVGGLVFGKAHDGVLGGAGVSDRDSIPLVRVEPTYPERAAERGIEGWVEVEFTISAAGTVKDPKIIASTSNVFHKAVLDAIRKWRYQPRIEDGKPVERPGERTVLKFTLEK
jgi:protein TonB